MKLHTTLAIFLSLSTCLLGQDYTSYFTGNTSDVATTPTGGICLMGGATEHDEAMKWFLQRANGGDVLVLRASGSDGYNDYFYTDLGITVNSVETIVCNNASTGTDPYIVDKIGKAEAIWFAGGDQWNYISYWRNTPVDSAINAGLSTRNIVIGGTSAGMAIQGAYYFSAENGTVTSSSAMSDPFGTSVTVENAPFINNPQLTNLITDTHFDNPDRSGRLMTFMARMRTDDGIAPRAIACNEYVAVCIDPSGNASVYGDYPNYDEFAFFLQWNCEEANNDPEICTSGSPLTWSVNNNAVKVYKVPGTMNGANAFSLSDWSTGSGGTWESWSVTNGTLLQQSSTAVNCSLSIDENDIELNISPIPADNELVISSDVSIESIEIFSSEGKLVLIEKTGLSTSHVLNIEGLNAGVYILNVHSKSKIHSRKLIVY